MKRAYSFITGCLLLLASCGDPAEAVINIQLLKYDPKKLQTDKEQGGYKSVFDDEWWASTAPFHLSKYQLDEKGIHTSIKVSSVDWKLEEGLWYASGPGNSVYLPADPDAVQAIASYMEAR